MTRARNIVINLSQDTPAWQRDIEICEHKGAGHPDTVTDAVCEAASRELSRAYLRETGAIQHHNVDKGLLVAGQSQPRFGGGEWVRPIRLIVCGRGTEVPGCIDPSAIALAAARQHLQQHLRCDLSHFDLESAIRPGSANLLHVFNHGTSIAVANDTSFGVGYAPFSPLEQAVLALSSHLESAAFRTAFPAAGDDFKIMGVRQGTRFCFTVALAFVDRFVKDAAHYFSLKQAICADLSARLDLPADVRLNTLDDPRAVSEDGLYLTVSGLSAEMGDDGQVGRGNRANGLITPCRPMSLEATAGKNPSRHVGKIYNVLARLMADSIHGEIGPGVDVQVRLVSTIGAPVDQPQLAQVELLGPDPVSAARRDQIRRIVEGWLNRVEEIPDMILEEKVRLF